MTVARNVTVKQEMVVKRKVVVVRDSRPCPLPSIADPERKLSTHFLIRQWPTVIAIQANGRPVYRTWAVSNYECVERLLEDLPRALFKDAIGAARLRARGTPTPKRRLRRASRGRRILTPG